MYEEFRMANCDVLLDDRGERVGVMLAEWELIGIPIRILISSKLVEANSVEVFERRSLKTRTLSVENCIEKICRML